MSQQLAERPPVSMVTIPEERNELHQALDRLIDVGIGGSTHDPNVAAAFLEWASRKAILLSPIMGAFRLQPFWELAFTKLKVDTSKEAKMVYSVSNFGDDDSSSGYGPNTPLAFHKPLLNIIRTHLGIELLNMERIGTIDPLCHEYKVYGQVLGVDGRLHALLDQGGLDLRDGSPAAQKVLAEARGKNAEEKERNGRANLMRMRAKILQRATTNAEERLILSYGFRSSYTKKELDEKYIVCVRPIETGYHPNPEMQKMWAEYKLRGAHTAASVLYGAPEMPELSLPPTINAALPSMPADVVQPETAAEPKPEVKTCSPDECFGHGSQHVRACSIPDTGEAQRKPDREGGLLAPSDWQITRGSARGLKISDSRVTPATLVEMRNWYITALDPNGPDFKEMTDERKDLLAGEMREVVQEMRRRGIKDDGEKKY